MNQPVLPAALLSALQAREPLLWVNPQRQDQLAHDSALVARIAEARDRLARADRLLRQLFGLPAHGPAITSPLLRLEDSASGPWFIKGDHALPVAGSIKARGGFHEVIAHAEALAISAGLIAAGDDLAALASPRARALFAGHSIVVGSTGNLGLSIGLCGAALGFKAVVHMSTDAKEWKKKRLRDHGAVVVEHGGDYGAAVAQGRAEAAADPAAHFVDDEHSVDLFCGYACAAYELQAQLQAAGVVISADNSLIVHLPCGVGGAPGGIAYGLHLVFGPDVFCYFAEPVESPCMLVQLASGSDEPVSVYDIGLTNRTELDGLAVATASPFVAPLMRARLAGIFTVSDIEAHSLLQDLHARTGIKIEPSAATALAGPDRVDRTGVHVSWATGGSLVPASEFAAFLAWGE